MPIRLNPKTPQEVDIYCRVYENQDPEYWADPNRDEKQQIVAEVLYKTELNLDNVMITAWLPRGAAEGIYANIAKWKDNDKLIGISNELPDTVGILTSCRKNFDIRMMQKLKGE